MKLAILGAGPGGYVAALKAARLGAEVTVIEESEVGGTCLNRGCIPTKALIASSDMYTRALDLKDFGIDLTGTVSPNLPSMVSRKDKIVATQVKGIRALFKSWGVSLVEGRGAMASPTSITVSRKDGSTETVEADRVIIATGSRPALIKAFPFDGSAVMTSDDALRIDSIPKSIIIVGAGVIGSEWACIFRSLGTEVTMVEMLPRPVATEDEEVSDLLAREFKKRKIKLMLSTGVESVAKDASGVTATLSTGASVTAERMLVSIGRTLNSDGIGLEAAGVKTGKRGEIEVNERMETSVPGVYAVGDVTGKLLLAHAASRQGIVASVNATGGADAMDYDSIPAAIFTSPEIASVGLREFQAAERGIGVKCGRFQYRALGKAHAMGEIAGFFKVIADSATDRVLGVHIIGPHASDIIHEGALAVAKGLKASDIAGTVHAHPTLSEGMMEAAEDVHGMAIHSAKA